MTILQMIAEWRKGCSCGLDNPADCPDCTVVLIDAIEGKLTSTGKNEVLIGLMGDAGLKNINALAKVSGVSGNTIKRIINLDINTLHKISLHKLSLFFGVSVRDLMPDGYLMESPYGIAFTDREVSVLESRVGRGLTFSSISRDIGVSASMIRTNYINAMRKVDALIKYLK